MGKLLLLILLGILLYLVFKRVGSARSRKAPPPAAAKVLRCAHCGLHVPAEEGVTAADKFYCCEEHRRLGQD